MNIDKLSLLKKSLPSIKNSKYAVAVFLIRWVRENNYKDYEYINTYCWGEAAKDIVLRFRNEGFFSDADAVGIFIAIDRCFAVLAPDTLEISNTLKAD